MDSTLRKDMVRVGHNQELPGTSIVQSQASCCARHHVQVLAQKLAT